MPVRYAYFATLMMIAATFGCAPAPTPGLTADKSVEPALRISGSGAALPVVRKLADAFHHTRPTAEFEFDAGTNSGGGIKGVLQGTLDLSVANRPLTEAEASESLEVHPFARDAVVLAAHQAGLEQGLSTSQVRQTYGGTLTDWAQLGISRGPIVVLDRDPDEPMRSLFLLPLLGSQQVEARTTVLTKAGDMLQALEGTSDSLGYTTLALLRIRQPKDVRVLALDGVTPGRASLQAGTYPWYLTYSLIHRPGASAAAQRFLEFVQGPGGRDVLAEYDAAAIQS